jgi:hypothetical protein
MHTALNSCESLARIIRDKAAIAGNPASFVAGSDAWRIVKSLDRQSNFPTWPNKPNFDVEHFLKIGALFARQRHIAKESFAGRLEIGTA